MDSARARSSASLRRQTCLASVREATNRLVPDHTLLDLAIELGAPSIVSHADLSDRDHSCVDQRVRVLEHAILPSWRHHGRRGWECAGVGRHDPTTNQLTRRKHQRGVVGRDFF